MKPACANSADVEAARDGRLAAAELERVQRHVRECPECAREQRALDALGARLRDAAYTPDQFGLRRLRRATLERTASLSSHGIAPAQSRALSTRRRALLAGALVLASVGSAAVYYSRGPHPSQSALTARSLGDARWSQRRVAGFERIDLRDGTLHVSVRRAATDPRVVVRVPDGVIEDLGTVFEVTVRAGRTAQIAVTRGAVLFRRDDRTELRLMAGTRWTAPTPSVTPPPTGAVDARPAAPAITAGKREPAHATQQGAKPATPAHVAKRSARTPAGNSPASDGDVATAAEDRAYLETIMLLRAGRPAEARLAAKAYLKRFPHGFRRIELEPIANSH